MKYDIRTLSTDRAYAAKFRNEAEVERIGILTRRDLEQELVELLDPESGVSYIRPFDEIWAIDTAVVEESDSEQ